MIGILAGMQRRIQKALTGEGYREGARPPPSKIIFSLRPKWRVLVNSEQYVFVPATARKMLNFPPEVVIWWTLKMQILGSSEYAVSVVGLVSFLLHCNTSNLMLEILKQSLKGQFALASPGPPVIYADAVPCRYQQQRRR